MRYPPDITNQNHIPSDIGMPENGLGKMNKRRTQAKVESQPEKSIHNPELFFGLVGPIGVDIETVVEALARTLKEVDYDAEPVHLT